VFAVNQYNWIVSVGVVCTAYTYQVRDTARSTHCLVFGCRCPSRADQSLPGWRSHTPFVQHSMTADSESSWGSCIIPACQQVSWLEFGTACTCHHHTKGHAMPTCTPAADKQNASAKTPAQLESSSTTTHAHARNGDQASWNGACASPMPLLAHSTPFQ
jgi:hypothetical protein